MTSPDLATVVAAYFSNHQIKPDEIPTVVGLIRNSLNPAESPVVEPLPEPAVPVKKSVTKDAIVCLECGEKVKMLKRHLSAKHDLTASLYKLKWGLPKDYPMVAPSYAAQRSELAKAAGLGKTKAA